MRALPWCAACAVVVSIACEGAEPASEGARFEQLRSWSTVLDDEGAPQREWVSPGGELPPDILSVTLVANNVAGLKMSFDVRDATDKVLVDPARSEWSLNRALTTRGLAVAMLPSASAALPLTRNFRVAAHLRETVAGAPQADVTVFLKRPKADGGGVPAVQELLVVPVLVGDRVPNDGRLAEALETLADVWRAAGVRIQAAAAVRLPGPDMEPFERLLLDPELGSDSPDLGRLLELSDRLDPGLERPLPLFLVPDIVTGPGAAVWAVSGGIPVPPLPGTRRSGIAVNATLIQMDAFRAGQVMAHEVGHALGLYHTTEGTFVTVEGAPQAIHDQLDDTGACPAQADSSPKDGSLSPGECTSHDGRNLMFWAATRNSTELTRAQADIARRSALTR